MKKNALILICLVSISINAQKKLNDPSIVAQSKRQVYESWGDWRPYPKYVLGIQTNFAYATVWGWMSPKRNRDYKNGEDIRPLKSTGKEVQRLSLTELQKKETEKTKIEVDTLYKRNLQDFAHWTPTTASADPLWLLYYKRMLRPLEEFPPNPKNYKEWRLKDEQTYQAMLSFGKIEDLQRELDLLKDKFKQSRTLALPRGKRFLMYHECLLEWRKFEAKLKDHYQQTNIILDWKRTIDNMRGNKYKERQQTDTEIVQDAMNKFNIKIQDTK